MSRPTTSGEVLLSRDACLADVVVFVDGISRTGKSLLGPILSSFDRVEVERMEEIFEYVGALCAMGKIQRDCAISLLRLRADTYLYNSLIGRNSNFRVGDHSSVWNSSRWLTYVRRLRAPEGPPVLERLRAERPIFQNQTHDQLTYFHLHHEAFQNRLRVVEMIRHPIDLVDSWLRRGWGERFGEDPAAFTFCVRHQGRELPYYAIGWEDEYIESSELGRVLKMISRIWDANQATYGELTSDQKKQVMFIPFERFITAPHAYLPTVGNLLETSQTRRTAGALKRACCPREYDQEAHERRRKLIEGQASDDDRDILDRLIVGYERVVQEHGLG